MLGDPGVVWRALEGDVEGQLHAVGVRGGEQVVEAGEGAETGMDGLVAALSRADGPGTTQVVGAGVVLLLGVLRKARPMGSIGGRYRTVKAHGGDLRQQSSTSAKVPWRAGRSSFAGWRERLNAGRARTNWRSGRVRDRPRGGVLFRRRRRS